MANKSAIVESTEMTLDQKVVALLLCIAQERKVEIERALEGAVPSLLQRFKSRILGARTTH